MKMPLPYISYSAWSLYLEDPTEYFSQYFVCRVDKPTIKMKIGKIFQEAWCDRSYDFEKRLKEEGATSDIARAMKRALDSKDTIRLEKSETEKKYIVRHAKLKHPIIAIFDGETKRTIIENKYGTPWSKKMAEESKQLVWYSLVYKIRNGVMPQIILQTFSAKNGSVRQFKIKHKEWEIEQMIEEINAVVDRIKSGDFES